jgi:hypothetical protein
MKADGGGGANAAQCDAYLPQRARGCVSLLFKLRFLQDPQGEEQGLAVMSKMADVKVNDLQHEEILSNFDSFLKLAGNELGSVRDLAKNMTGRHPDQYM